MPRLLTVYYALQSPWSYLGWQRFLELAADKQLKVTFRPIKTAAIFAAGGGLPLAERPIQRQAYRMMELKRWPDYLGLPLNVEPAFFPVDEGLAARLVLAHAQRGGDPGPLSLALMRAVWVEERNLADRETVHAVATEQGMDASALIASAETEHMQSAYEAGTEEAIRAGVFGVPTFALDTELFWGQDRLELLAHMLG